MTLATGSRGAAARRSLRQAGGGPGMLAVRGAWRAAGCRRSLLAADRGIPGPFSRRWAPLPRTSSAPRTRWRAAGCRPSRTWPAATGSTSRAHPPRPRFASRATHRTLRRSPIPTTQRPSSSTSRPRARPTTPPSSGARRSSIRRLPRPFAMSCVDNEKVPLTSIEQALQITAGPSSGHEAKANLRPYRLPGTRARLGFATSLPAFEFGNDFGEAPPSVAPCADVSLTYMRCLDHLGANVVLQDEANPGQLGDRCRLGHLAAAGVDGLDLAHGRRPTVGFDYNVTPFMVGNLADLPFDGQSADHPARRRPRPRLPLRRQRALPARPTGVGPARGEPLRGRKHEFIALAPWVKHRPRTHEPPRHRRPRSPRAPATRARTTTSRRR